MLTGTYSNNPFKLILRNQLSIWTNIVFTKISREGSNFIISIITWVLTIWLRHKIGKLHHSHCFTSKTNIYIVAEINQHDHGKYSKWCILHINKKTATSIPASSSQTFLVHFRKIIGLSSTTDTNILALRGKCKSVKTRDITQRGQNKILLCCSTTWLSFIHAFALGSPSRFAMQNVHLVPMNVSTTPETIHGLLGSASCSVFNYVGIKIVINNIIDNWSARKNMGTCLL